MTMRQWMTDVHVAGRFILKLMHSMARNKVTYDLNEIVLRDVSITGTVLWRTGPIRLIIFAISICTPLMCLDRSAELQDLYASNNVILHQVLWCETIFTSITSSLFSDTVVHCWRSCVFGGWKPSVWFFWRGSSTPLVEDDSVTGDGKVWSKGRIRPP